MVTFPSGFAATDGRCFLSSSSFDPTAVDSSEGDPATGVDNAIANETRRARGVGRFLPTSGRACCAALRSDPTAVKQGAASGATSPSSQREQEMPAFVIGQAQPIAGYSV